MTWRPTDDVTLWAAYRSGYKSGGFSTNTVLSAASTGDGLTFQPEEANGGEFGIKSTILDGRLRLNATAYYYKFDDIQISVFDAATVSFAVDNAASADTTGIEVEAIYVANERLTLRGQFGYNQGDYDDFTDSACYGGQTAVTGCVNGVQDLSGEALTRSPELQGSLGFDYEQPISSGWVLALAGEAIFSDKFQTNTNNNPLSIQDSFWRLNARVGILSTDDKWEFSLVGRNLADELYQGGQADKPGAPGGRDLFGGVVRGRQIIAQGKYRF